jgi:hypothetical protein
MLDFRPLVTIAALNLAVALSLGPAFLLISPRPASAG